ncbi:hypothetical protein KsCSTR_46240 [Candidatus Kuenenia stuttgartiensis]|uniref:Uncharacterized protein n=1 Tax=Kuenenia stuttgartiensis TaxID=174633 RepID=Q1PWA7_KUEST|nr:hypothetical protein KsCSTR_46240 [Candidatus Kuenenia stuttgartiensis]CAJ71517.1 unknown protein [Candidatus Kuenenia stuttgartiensis]
MLRPYFFKKPNPELKKCSFLQKKVSKSINYSEIDKSLSKDIAIAIRSVTTKHLIWCQIKFHLIRSSGIITRSL